MLKSKSNLLSKYMVALPLFAIAGGLVVFTACMDNNAKATPNFITKDTPPAPGVLAKINGQNITLEELIGDGEAKLTYGDLKKREHKFLMDRLNDVMRDRLIGEEAKKANLPLDEYLKKNVYKGKTTVKKDEIIKFVEQRGGDKSRLNPQIEQRIEEMLRQQKEQDLMLEYLAKLTKKNPVEVFFKRYKVQVNVDAGESPTWGNKTAPVSIIAFSDFQCPYCSKAADTVDQIRKKYRGKVKIAFKHFPLSFHKDAMPAAIASMCVNEQNSDKFWKFHDVTFKNQSALSPADLDKYAKESGADMGKFKACMDSKKYEGLVKKDMEYGDKLGVRSTPTFFVNGELISGAVPIEEFSQTIDDALNEAKGS
ncbi:MAG: DsbA family protein [Bacteriovoracia bacterium]